MARCRLDWPELHGRIRERSPERSRRNRLVPAETDESRVSGCTGDLDAYRAIRKLPIQSRAPQEDWQIEINETNLDRLVRLFAESTLELK